MLDSYLRAFGPANLGFDAILARVAIKYILYEVQRRSCVRCSWVFGNSSLSCLAGRRKIRPTYSDYNCFSLISVHNAVEFQLPISNSTRGRLVYRTIPGPLVL